MKIRSIMLRGIGPFQAKQLLYLSFDDQRVLLRGLSGSGKSTLLQIIAYLWCAGGKQAFDWPFTLKEHDFAGMVLLDYLGEDWLIYLGKLTDKEKEEINKEQPRLRWINVGEQEALPRIAGKEEPNILLYENEVTKYKASSDDHWFFTDEDVRKMAALYEKSGVEDIKKGAPRLKKILTGKQLLLTGQNKWVVQLRDIQQSQLPFESLSLGEKNLFYLYFGVLIYLKQNGVLLLDEPALHLHPDQIVSSLAGVEAICRERKAQLIIVSHNQQAWQRYDALGLVIDLSPQRTIEGNGDEND